MNNVCLKYVAYGFVGLHCVDHKMINKITNQAVVVSLSSLFELHMHFQQLVYSQSKHKRQLSNQNHHSISFQHLIICYRGFQIHSFHYKHIQASNLSRKVCSTSHFSQIQPTQKLQNNSKFTFTFTTKKHENLELVKIKNEVYFHSLFIIHS